MPIEKQTPDNGQIDIEIIGNIENYCFTCLKNNKQVEDISQNEIILGKFKKIFNFEVEVVTGSPKNICKLCLNRLNEASEFHSQITRCILYFVDFVNAQKNVKIEEDSVKIELDHDVFEKHDSNSESESDYEPLSRLAKKSTPFNAKLKKIPLDLIEKTIEDYQNKYKKNSNCIICDFKGVSIRNLSSHMIHKHKEKRNKWCSRCNMLFDNIERHRKIHSDKTWCKFCSKNIARLHYLEHLKNHAGLDYSCEECQKKFISQKALEEHAAQHVQTKPFQCPSCPKLFKQIKSLEDHISLHGRYTCNECNKHFEIPELLASHLCNGNSGKPNDHIVKCEDNERSCDEKIKSEEETKDGADEMYVKESITRNVKVKKVEDLICHFCQKNYKNAYKLQKHIEAHMGIFTTTCRFCGKGFSCNSDLTNHERVHTKEKPFICNVCGKGFVSGATLRVHLKRHTGKPEECELCHKRFCRKSELKLHLQKHRGERPFLCTNCGKSFAQKSHLTCHLTIHSDERPFSCTMCGRSFKKKELLKHHMKLHGEKKFKCSICDYECHKNYRLQQHMKMHDGKVDLKVNICQLCSKGFSTISLLNNHMTNVHSVIV
ncbi:uncharacterized protein LOC143192381 isoform X1 [Rhynchophorus ferrugineus]|uniref:uncharacterized protein LOC143192381 isoform X1 n=1 Tax=Rhynchophorus ferrugineus TaxID=354439 RepID=UPI003FCDAE84